MALELRETPACERCESQTQVRPLHEGHWAGQVQWWCSNCIEERTVCARCGRHLQEDEGRYNLPVGVSCIPCERKGRTQW